MLLNFSTLKRAIIVLLLIFSANSIVYSQGSKIDSAKYKKQVYFSFGMGISMSTTPSLNDYLIHYIPFNTKDSVKTFSVGLEFFGGVEMQFSRRFSLKLDYSYFFKGNTYNYPPFIYDISFQIHQPVLMAFYIIPGKGFQLKLGGGIGYSFARLSNTVSGSEIIYHSRGPGFKTEFVFDAQLSKRLGSYLSGFVMGNSLGNLKDSNDNILQDPLTKANVNLNDFGLGLRLGMSIKIK
jgi:hypothetical protein